VHKSPVNPPGFLALLTGLFLLAAMPAFSQSSAISADLPQAEVDRIINTFTAKESQFRKALNEYSFKRDAILQSVGMGGQVTGEYHRVSYFTFDDSGNRFEKISFFPMPSFAAVTQEDLNDLGGIQPFALEPAKIPQYDFRYVGREKIDELNLYVFDVSPKVLPDAKKTKERFFKGRVWVEDQDFQIVKTRGKGLPETKNNKFPTVETYREQIDGRYWFPTYSYADDELLYESGETLHVRMQVRYSDFVKASAKVKIIEIENPDAPTKETKPVSPPPPRKP
jgi:muconolactone delta-isomerase